jgi:PII-like signaling protein
MLGLLSISTAELSLVVAWLLSQILQMGLAGAVTGSGLAGLRPGTLFLRVIVLVLSLAVVTIIIQNVGG